MSPELEARLAELREKYRLGLPSKHAAIAAELALVREDRSRSVDDVEMLAHRLHGTASAYGFCAVGDAAGRLERRLSLLTRPGPEPGLEDSWQALELALLDLEREISAALARTRAPEAQGVAALCLHSVLLVDDEDDIRTIGRIALEDVGGLRVFLARSGDEGLRVAALEHPDVILLDVMMPGMDGPTTLAKLRGDPKTAAIPVVFVTAKAQPNEIERYLAAGARGVIAKPFDPMSLPDQLRRVLGA